MAKKFREILRGLMASLLCASDPKETCKRKHKEESKQIEETKTTVSGAPKSSPPPLELPSSSSWLIRPRIQPPLQRSSSNKI